MRLDLRSYFIPGFLVNYYFFHDPAGPDKKNPPGPVFSAPFTFTIETKANDLILLHEVFIHP